MKECFHSGVANRWAMARRNRCCEMTDIRSPWLEDTEVLTRLLLEPLTRVTLKTEG